MRVCIPVLVGPKKSIRLVRAWGVRDDRQSPTKKYWSRTEAVATDSEPAILPIDWSSCIPSSSDGDMPSTSLRAVTLETRWGSVSRVPGHIARVVWLNAWDLFDKNSSVRVAAARSRMPDILPGRVGPHHRPSPYPEISVGDRSGLRILTNNSRFDPLVWSRFCSANTLGGDI